MANEVILNTIFQVKRGQSEAWARNNPILRAGEPGFELDTLKLKIGNGTTAWNDLPYINDGSESILVDGSTITITKNGSLSLAGFLDAEANTTPVKTEKGTIEWKRVENASREEIILEVEEKISQEITKVKQVTEKIRYEVTSKPEGTLVDYRDKEIRIMCPVGTKWEKQNVGAGGNKNLYYAGFKAYAPEGAYSFKEDDQDSIQDDTMYYFENNPFAGIDEHGRKYSIFWLALASYDESTDTWTYFGKNSSFKKYLGWYYSIEWYNKEGVKIDSDLIRINLANEDCFKTIKPFYLQEYVSGIKVGNDLIEAEEGVVTIPIATENSVGLVLSSSKLNHIAVNMDGTMKVNSISVDKLVNVEGVILILDGGSATMN